MLLPGWHTSICEIRGYQNEPQSFTVIYDSMALQSWWRYGSCYSFEGSDNKEAYFYLLAELTPSLPKVSH